MTDKVLVAYVLFNTVTTHGKDVLLSSIAALENQSNFKLNENLFVDLYDNGSSDKTLETVQSILRSGITLIQNQNNLGFAAACNQAFKRFLNSDYNYIMLLNSDVILESEAIDQLVKGFLESDKSNDRLGVTCPRLLSFTEAGSEKQIDGYGMRLTKSLRHFDLGAGKRESQMPTSDFLVFGASGACLMTHKDFVRDLQLSSLSKDNLKFKIYPQLEFGNSERVQVFDEAFFAYREDADLAWRAQARGWQCKLVASAVGSHKRVVKPELRAEIDPLINYYSVRNRFLLQISNFEIRDSPESFLKGCGLRNLLVLIAVIIKERTSLKAFRDLIVLLPRALEIRRINKHARRVSATQMRKWFEND